MGLYCAAILAKNIIYFTLQLEDSTDIKPQLWQCCY